MTAARKTRQRATEALSDHGLLLVEDIGEQDSAAGLLAQLGELIPQYDGRTTHEVICRPGHENLAYSQSNNTICAHTEAPGWNPSPAYLALFCHRQASCGGGHTDLLDVELLLPCLDKREIALMSEREIEFPGTGGPDRPVRLPMLSAGPNERPVLRFSFNYLTTGTYEPASDTNPADWQLPLGADGRALALRVHDLFLALRTRVLVPEKCLLVWDNHRMLHARSRYRDPARHLTRFWVSDGSHS